MEGRLKRVKTPKALLAVATGLTLAAAASGVETLEMSRALDSGSTSTNSNVFSTVLSITNAASNTGDVAVLASFSGSPGGGQGVAVGQWRLSSGADVSVVATRDMSDSSNDFGVVNLAWIFTNLAPSATVDLEHRSPSGKTIRTAKVTLVAIPLTTASNAVTLKHDQDSLSGFTFYTPTDSTSFVPVEQSDGSPVAASVLVDFVQVPKALFIVAVATTQTAGGNPVDGLWKLELNEQGSPPAVPCQDGTQVGTQVRRALSGAADSGAVVLYAIAETLSNGTYDIRLCARSDTLGEAVGTQDVALLAFGLSYAAFPGGHFPHIQDTVASATVTNGSMDPIPSLLEGFTLRSASDMFLALSFTAFTTTSGAGDFGEFETCIEDSVGAYPFGRDQNGASQEVRRFFSSSDDFGVGGQVGLAKALAAGTYSARGCASVTGNPVTFRDPNLVGFVPVSLDDATVPVTLASFSSRGRGRVLFEWSTATEVGNLGFNLYALEGDSLRRLNRDLIPSRAVDSIEPRFYRYEADGVAGDAFLIEDVDLLGKSRFHGPFYLGESSGQTLEQVRPIPWGRIRRSHLAQRTERTRLAHREAAPGQRSYPEAVLRVSRDGLHRVTHEALLAGGVDLTGVPLQHLALSSRGEPVAIRVEGRGRFGPGAFIEFVGEALDTLYTGTNVYTLRVDRAAALRAGRDRRPPRPGASTPAHYLATTRVEENRQYHFASPVGDPWYDTRLLAISGPVEATFDLEMEGYLPAAGPVQLELSLWGVTDFPQAPDHHLLVDVNGVTLADEWFDGLVGHPLSLEVPDALLEPTGNWLTLRLPHDTGARYDLVNYDHYRITYPRRFEAEEGRLRFAAAAEAFRVENLPSAEVVVYRAAGGEVELVERVEVEARPGGYSARFAGSKSEATHYLSAVEALLVPDIEPGRPAVDITTGEAELLIVSHPDFIAGLEPLVAARRAEGYAVRVVDVEDVYARFGHGIFDPEAIRAYLAHAHEAMGTGYVLLVGGDTYDYRDHLGHGSISFLPSLYAQTGEIVRYAPVDPLYGDVDGDAVPDLAIGRLPVRTPAELESVIDKTLAYEAASYRGSATFAADVYDGSSGTSFSTLSDEFIGLLPAGWMVERAYIDELGLGGARQSLVDGIHGGTGLTSYFGHSGLSVWSFLGLFRSADAVQLENSGRPTVVTQWGCWNTYYVSPSYDTLGHALLLSGDRGAAAVLGASTLTQIASEQLLGAHFMPRLTTPGATLGAALLEAKRQLAAAYPDLADVILGWTLLGDPTLQVAP